MNYKTISNCFLLLFFFSVYYNGLWKIKNGFFLHFLVWYYNGLGTSFSCSRKECYKLDYCYEQNEGNGIIFAREVKPLISEVFNGINATIVACGAKGSGKTRVIQVEIKSSLVLFFLYFTCGLCMDDAYLWNKFTMKGSYEEPGLAALAVDEILSISEKMGKSITISFYEIFQDRVYDLLDPKQQEVQILENGQGKIQLKGLSQVRYILSSVYWTLGS